MSTLNNRLQLALLKRKRSGNPLQKGFTLVELMIVIVIVGILSAVALPNFLSQSNKARATEGKTQVSAVLKQAGASYHENGAITAGACTGELADAITNANLAVSEKYTLAFNPTCEEDATSLTVVATGANSNFPNVTGTITLATGVVAIN
jgi:type IV pilus assembly protein PilA